MYAGAHHLKFGAVRSADLRLAELMATYRRRRAAGFLSADLRTEHQKERATWWFAQQLRLAGIKFDCMKALRREGARRELVSRMQVIRGGKR
jgi:hypothetical protein